MSSWRVRGHSAERGAAEARGRRSALARRRVVGLIDPIAKFGRLLRVEAAEVAGAFARLVCAVRGMRCCEYIRRAMDCVKEGECKCEASLP